MLARQLALGQLSPPTYRVRACAPVHATADAASGAVARPSAAHPPHARSRSHPPAPPPGDAVPRAPPHGAARVAALAWRFQAGPQRDMAQPLQVGAGGAAAKHQVQHGQLTLAAAEGGAAYCSSVWARVCALRSRVVASSLCRRGATPHSPAACPLLNILISPDARASLRGPHALSLPRPPSNGKSAVRVDAPGVHQAGPHLFVGPPNPRCAAGGGAAFAADSSEQ